MRRGDRPQLGLEEKVNWSRRGCLARKLPFPARPQSDRVEKGG
jgi:hypothetical protein